MTDEELAVNWIRSQGWSEENLPSDEFERMLQAFLAGIKLDNDINVSTKWHDLRKDPNDLPKRNNELTDRSDVIITDKGMAHYNFRKQKWYVHNFEWDMSFPEGVIAWCEIPVFEGV